MPLPCPLRSSVTRPLRHCSSRWTASIPEATTSAFTIERLDRLQAQLQQRPYSRSRGDADADADHGKGHAQRSAAAGKYPGRQPKVHPRMRPGMFSLVGPMSSTTPTPPHTVPYQQTQKLKVLYTLLHDDTSDPHDLYRAYAGLYRLSGGVTLLSPGDMRRLILRTARPYRPAINPRQVLSRILTLLDGAVQALHSYAQRPTSTEAQEWRDLIHDEDIKNELVRLVSRSLRRPTQSELHDAFQMFRSRAHDSYSHNPRAHLQSFNLLLDVVARSVPDSAVTLRSSKLAEPLEDLQELDTSQTYLEDLFHEDETQNTAEQVTKSIQNASKIFAALWSALHEARLKPDAQSYSARIMLEAKRGTTEVLSDLHRALSPEQSMLPAHTEGSPLLPRGWARVQDTLRRASQTQVLTSMHVNQAIHEYSRLRLKVKLTLESTATTEDRLQAIDGVIPSLSPFVSAQKAARFVQKVYETMRWNQVQAEMVAITQRAATAAEEQTSSSSRLADQAADVVKSWFPTFWDRFGTSPSAPKGVDADHVAMASEPSSSMLAAGLPQPTLDLLGIPLPAALQPDLHTFTVLLRYFAATEGDYPHTVQVLQDYRQSQSTEGDDKLADLPPRACTIGMLNVLISAFAHHGVPAQLSSRWDSATQREITEWTLHHTVREDSPMAPWNVVNLLALFEESMVLRPGPTAKQVELQRQAEHYMRDSGVERGEHAHFRPPPPPDPALRRAPRPDQIWTWLVALRRVTGDRYNGLVLDWFERWSGKFGPRRVGVDHRGEHKAATDARTVVSRNSTSTGRWGQEDGSESAEVEAAESEATTLRRRGESELPDTLTPPPPPPPPPPLLPTSTPLYAHQALNAYRRYREEMMRRGESADGGADGDGDGHVADADVPSNANPQGWVGWKGEEDNRRLRDLLEFLRARRDMVG